MITAKTYQTLPVGQPDNRATRTRNPGQERRLSPNSGNDGPPTDRRSKRPKASRANGPTPEEAVALLASENLALQAALAAERKRCAELLLALESQSQAAITDPLTGLYNRRAMDQHLNALWAGQITMPLSVLMLDIDDFKRINDTYGHPSGDQVIRQVAETLRRCLRAEDNAFRYGGEEFMVLLPNTPLEGAIRVAESIRGRIEALNMAHHEDGLVQCTVSLGVAARQDREDRDSLFQRADRALYQAKSGGRNRVVHEELLN